MAIYTSYYSNKENIDTKNNCYVSISVGTPKWDLPYELYHCKVLKPFSIFGKYDNMVDYEREYRKYLDDVGVERILREFNAIKQASGKKNLVLLCYEKDKTECHRYTFAKWWFENTGEVVREIETNVKKEKIFIQESFL